VSKDTHKDRFNWDLIQGWRWWLQSTLVVEAWVEELLLVLLLGVVVEVEVFDEALEETLEILRWRWRDWVLGVRVFAWGRRRSWENSSLVEEM